MVMGLLGQVSSAAQGGAKIARVAAIAVASRIERRLPMVSSSKQA
jgi:hypothetical protein